MQIDPHLINGFEEQDENGIDLSHLRENLKSTPTERLKRHRRTHELWMEVERAATAAGLLPGIPE